MKAGKKQHIVIFTDLDGTLLRDDDYSYDEALPALTLINARNIPLILTSSKTRNEIELYRKRLGNNDPFISENGGGVFIPEGYFKKLPDHVPSQNGYRVINIGKKYPELRGGIESLRGMGCNLKGFGDMTAAEVAAETGLSNEEAMLAKERDFDEPFILEGDTREAELKDAVSSIGFKYTVGGKFFHLTGDNDKGRAVKILTDLYKADIEDLMTIALGDSPNDLPMLEAVDTPVIVQKPEGGYDERIVLPNLVKAESIGPAGWCSAVEKLVSLYGQN